MPSAFTATDPQHVGSVTLCRFLTSMSLFRVSSLSKRFGDGRRRRAIRRPRRVSSRPGSRGRPHGRRVSASSRRTASARSTSESGSRASIVRASTSDSPALGFEADSRPSGQAFDKRSPGCPFSPCFTAFSSGADRFDSCRVRFFFSPPSKPPPVELTEQFVEIGNPRLRNPQPERPIHTLHQHRQR